MRAYKGFADLIRSRRKELKLTLETVADHVGWSIPYVSELERGVKQPPPAPLSSGECSADLLALAEVLDLSADRVVNEARRSRRSVEIDLEGATALQRDLAVLLARRFDGGLTDEEARDIIDRLGQ